MTSASISRKESAQAAGPIQPARPTFAEICITIQNRILAMLKQGTIPWRKPWNSTWPMNLFSHGLYSGVNVFFLALSGFGSPYWCTAKQIAKHKGRIKDAEITHSNWVLFWHSGYTNKISLPGAVMHHSVPRFYKCYDAYNVEQTEGLERFIPKTRVASQ